jgi:hypothetical protein
MAVTGRSQLRHANGCDFERNRHSVKMLHVIAGKAAGVISCESLAANRVSRIRPAVTNNQGYFHRLDRGHKPTTPLPVSHRR